MGGGVGLRGGRNGDLMFEIFLKTLAPGNLTILNLYTKKIHLLNCQKKKNVNFFSKYV